MKDIDFLLQKCFSYIQYYKQTFDKNVKPKNYTFDDKIRFNNKYIKT